jgi:hypothetical protein
MSSKLSGRDGAIKVGLSAYKPFTGKAFTYHAARRWDDGLVVETFTCLAT